MSIFQEESFGKTHDTGTIHYNHALLLPPLYLMFKRVTSIGMRDEIGMKDEDILAIDRFSVRESQRDSGLKQDVKLRSEQKRAG